MTAPSIPDLLAAVSQGDRNALDDLFTITYQELKLLAHHHRLRWTGNATMGTTVLVHEAYQKLVGQGQVPVKDRAHFLAVAARAMRHILINYAEQQAAGKRGGNAVVVPLDHANPVAPQVAEEVLALNHALERLNAVQPRQSRVVECRFFGGMTIEETAHVLEVSPATVSRDWMDATIWLRRQILEPSDRDDGQQDADVSTGE